MENERCPYQKKNGTTCAKEIGKYCKGRPDLLYCKAFIIHPKDKFFRKEEPFYQEIIWASGYEQANHKFNVGIMGRQNSMMFEMTKLDLNSTLIKKLQKRIK